MPSQSLCCDCPTHCLLSLPHTFSLSCPLLLFFVCLLSPTGQGTWLSWAKETLAEKREGGVRTGQATWRSLGSKGPVRISPVIEESNWIYMRTTEPNLNSLCPWASYCIAASSEEAVYRHVSTLSINKNVRLFRHIRRSYNLCAVLTRRDTGQEGEDITQKHTAGSTVMQLCERARWWSCTARLRRSCRALDSSGRRWMAVGSDSHWKSNRSFSSSSSCWSTELSLEKGRKGGKVKGKKTERNEEGQIEKEAEWRTKSCRQTESDVHVSYFWQHMLW